MDQISAFHQLQERLAGCYSRSVSEVDRARVARIERHGPAGRKRILELGCGGGQTAAAVADYGHDVMAIEINESAARHATGLASVSRTGRLTVVKGDFYTTQVEGPFDLVCYWDGFGVGDDADQRVLLSRISQWLEAEAVALLDIYTPWYWKAMAGQTMFVGAAQRRYDFDDTRCRMLDTWWPRDDESQPLSQSLRCYSPVDLALLLEGGGLQLRSVEPGGAIDYQSMTYRAPVPLGDAMQYLAVITPVRTDTAFSRDRLP